MNEKREKIKGLIIEMIEESSKNAIENIDGILKHLDDEINNWEEINTPMILPKAIVLALLKFEHFQYLPTETFRKTVTKLTKKASRYIGI